MEVDLSIPENAPDEVVQRLLELRQELEEGDITAKGYRKHRENVLGSWNAQVAQAAQEDPQGPGAEYRATSIRSKRRLSGIDSIYSYQESFSTAYDARMQSQVPVVTAQDLAALKNVQLQAPIPPRGIPETSRADPLNLKVQLNKFDNLPSILRHRGQTNADIVAFRLLDKRGKEQAFITWGKLASKAEKVGLQLREHSGLFRGDRVVLVYAEHEPFEFIVALMGTFLAGLVAVSISPTQIAELPQVLHATQCHLVLTSDAQLKQLKQSPDKLARIKDVTWWKTTEWGSYYPSKKKGELPALQVPDLAYIDYGRAPNGELRGVVVSHRTILHKMTCLTAILQSREMFKGNKKKSYTDRLLCSLDMRRSTGFIFGVLHTIYSGNITSFMSRVAMSVPGLFAHTISRDLSTIILSDYPALKQVCYNYQAEPNATRNFSKKLAVNLSSLRWALIDAASIDAEFQTVFADRWLKPLGNTDARDILTPMLTLAEHGGMVIAMRDWLSASDIDNPRSLNEVYIDRTALKSNRIEFVGERSQDAMPLSPFGYPLPDATVAIVDPETTILSEEGYVGEIWIDSPSLSGGLWGLAEDTANTFHAKCYDQTGQLSLEYLRTGLLGFLIDNVLYVLGLLEDRVTQVYDESHQPSGGFELGDQIYYYSSHLVYTIMRNIPRVYDACVFQVPLGDHMLSAVVIETPLARKTSTPVTVRSKTEAQHDLILDEMCQQTISLLESSHGLRVYCVLVAVPNATPRIIRSGRPDIAKLLVRRFLMTGKLPAVHIRFNVDAAIDWVPHGEHLDGGIWSAAASHVRSQRLKHNEKQYSGVDMREEVFDDRAAVSLDEFASISHILQWRINRQAGELAYLTLNFKPQESNRETSWKRLDQHIAAVYHYIKDHLKIRTGDVAILMYTHSEEYVAAVHACFLLGVTVIPMSPANTDRLDEDMSALNKLIKQFKVTVLLGNHETQAIMEEKLVAQQVKRYTIPKIHNTAKVKVTQSGSIKSVVIDPKCLAPNFPALVWIYWTADYTPVASQLSHKAILGMCKIQKETCQMTSTRPIIGCVRSNCGLGFLYSLCIGAYIGASTLFVSPMDFANNPGTFFLTASRYKVKDSYSTVQMLQHACKHIKPRGFSLSELSNFVIAVEGRVDTELVNNARLAFASTGLESVAINMAYGTVTNPMITTRSYMLIESFDLWLDPIALRQGYIMIVNPANCPNALHLQDSGMVPINTQVAIVNPESRRLCRTGEFGEIWVVSDGNQTNYFVKDKFFNEQISHGIILDGDPNVEYQRTGDFGFLHNITKNSEVEMQVLYVLGPISQTLEINGLQHFVFDIEKSVEECHPSIGSTVLFSMGSSGLSIIVVETTSGVAYLSCLAAVVVNKVAIEHEFVLDIVTFVTKDKIPRSRLNEKQRGRLVESYVDGTLPLLGQYGVRAQS